MTYRDYTFLGTTQSLCPECLALVPTKIVSRQERVYFQKRCTTHGPREDFVCSDVRWFDRTEFSLPGKVPQQFGLEPRLGCPYDCGLCTEHEQHTCVGLLEITSSCNLTCPMCFAASAPGGTHLSVEDCQKAIDRLVEIEGQAEILQLSGGEPTIHPQFMDVFHYACDQPIDIVMVNTNGIRLARDPAFVQQLAEYRHRAEIYFQLDGFEDHVDQQLRGESLVETKLQAIDALGTAGLRTTLVCTLQPGVNEDQIGRLVQYGTERSWITGVCFQPATYTGRYVLPEQLEQRITFPDVLRRVEEQSAELPGCSWLDTDFTPLPCAHPNAHTLAYAYRSRGRVVPLARFMQLAEHLDLLGSRITFNRPLARQLIQKYLSRQPCGQGGCDSSSGAACADTASKTNISPQHVTLAEEFFARVLAEDLDPEDVFRITTTSFMDAYNFDVRQLMKSCVHHLLPSGHVIPFSAYNVLYRDGHVPLPPLRDDSQELRQGKRPDRAVVAEEHVEIVEKQWSVPLTR